MENSGTRDSIFSELDASLENTRRRLEGDLRQPLDTPIAVGRNVCQRPSPAYWYTPRNTPSGT